MKRSLYIIKHELLFLKSLVDNKILEINKVNSAVDKALDKLSLERNLNRQDLIKIILINFKYSVLDMVKETNLKFNFTNLSLKEICYFYFMHRLKDSSSYLT
ncbi:MAG: hypothetical protein OEV44_14925 [Spirochaetota bacterium]|nr:hypothetical protein [Spirochaetota bacterium]